ncbi:putative phosphothreonine lyase domain-containing protein [Nanoarchaeota archaeon]
MEKPSKVKNEYWVYAFYKGVYPRPTRNGGKWLIFVYNEDVDRVWERIVSATQRGALGDDSKCATAKPNPEATNPKVKVICIYTYDSTDREDVGRIAWKIYDILKSLSIEFTYLNYKENRATRQGKYKGKGHKKISKYTLKKEDFEGKGKNKFIKFFQEEFG